MSIWSMLFGSNEKPSGQNWKTVTVKEHPAEPVSRPDPAVIDSVCYTAALGWHIPLRHEQPVHGSRMLLLDKVGGYQAYVFKNGSWVPF